MIGNDILYVMTLSGASRLGWKGQWSGLQHWGPDSTALLLGKLSVFASASISDTFEANVGAKDEVRAFCTVLDGLASLWGTGRNSAWTLVTSKEGFPIGGIALLNLGYNIALISLGSMG